MTRHRARLRRIPEWLKRQGYPRRGPIPQWLKRQGWPDLTLGERANMVLLDGLIKARRLVSGK